MTAELLRLAESDIKCVSSTTTVVGGLPVQALPTSWPVVDSRSVTAEWRDGLLDADGGTKRLSMQKADGRYCRSVAPTLTACIRALASRDDVRGE